jgi:putative RecB family exonuclease
MTVYSHSRLSCFENCPYQYKLKYIDRVKVDVPGTIEAFMGGLVHETLDKLYKDVKFQKDISKEELLEYYNKLWEETFSEDLIIVKSHLTADNYRKMGEKFIEDYYDTYKPFKEMYILGLETQDTLNLPDGNQWHIRIDKLGCVGDTYFICDYKTNSRMKFQDEADSDRQLAMYSIWVKEKFKDAKQIILKWNMLAFNKEVISLRTPEQLERLKQEVMQKIKEIETAKEFPRKQSPLCNYCEYKHICPSMKHLFQPKETFEKDAGKVLVDSLKELRDKEDDIKKKIREYSQQHDVDVVYGSHRKATVTDRSVKLEKNYQK